jgi:CO/xanthine dehydrogenase FAD-binding subunit
LNKEVKDVFARPGLPSFDYVRAREPGQVIELLQKHGEKAKLLMGGTDLLPGLRDGVFHPQVVIDLKQLPGMRDVLFSPGEGLTVGAAVTMNTLVAHPDVQSHFPLLAEAAGAVASYQIRNRATLGGNLCNASPCADTAPATLVLEAQFILYGPDGERSMPAGEFFLGPGRTALRPGEFMTAIRFPLPPAGAAASYQKLGRCKAGDLALVGVAALGNPAPSAPSGYQFRIGLGSVAPTPLRAWAAEEALACSIPPDKAFSLAAEKARSAASPITDVRGTADYQLAMVRTLSLRALQQVWAALKEGN